MHIEDWDGDGHSHSWMTLEEAALIFERTDHMGYQLKRERVENKNELIRRLALGYFNIEMGMFNCPLSHYRIVFFFDN